MTSTERVKNRRHFIKQSIIYVMGGKCQCCGYDKCQSALELHHINSEEKEFSFGRNANRTWELIETELPKCLLVCANCHREIHFGLIDGTTLFSSFDENKAKEIRENSYWRQSRSKKMNKTTGMENRKIKNIHCIDCGELISGTSGTGLCPKCAKKRMRITEWPSREELKNLIRTTPFTKIGLQYNVSDNTIRKWCKYYNLPSKSREIKTYSEEEWKNI